MSTPKKKTIFGKINLFDVAKKYMLSKRSGSKSFWSQKMAIFDIFFFKFHYIKSTFFNPKQLVNGLCQVIYLLKKFTFRFIKLLRAVESKFKNDA